MEYNSNSLGIKRKIVVYTPPNYSADVNYPVFYLLHGAGDDETGWQQKGSANIILDSLYADGKLVPMLVVMPNGNSSTATGGGRGFGGGRGGRVMAPVTPNGTFLAAMGGSPVISDSTHRNSWKSILSMTGWKDI